MKKKLAVALLCVVLLNGLAGAYVYADGSIGGRPANPDPDNPRTQSIFIMNLKGGESKGDTATVVNTSNKEQAVRVYAVDGIVTSSGDFTCRQDSEVRKDVGSWTSITGDTISVPANSKQDIDFTVTVPERADVGEHNGCIVFQSANDNASTNASGVRIHMRQAVRLVVTVPGDLHRDITINSFTSSRQGESLLYNLSLKNTGNVSADVDAKVTLSNLWGGQVFSAGSGFPVIANQQLDTRFEQKDLPIFGGVYWTELTASYGKQAGTFGTGSGEQTVKKSGRFLLFIAPTATGYVIIALAAALVGTLIANSIRRKIRTAQTRRYGHKHKVLHAETIQSIARHYRVSWKRIASVNHIKAPYVVEEGTTLYVPKKRVDKKSK